MDSFNNQDHFHAFITNNIYVGVTYKIILLTDVNSPSLPMSLTVYEKVYECYDTSLPFTMNKMGVLIVLSLLDTEVNF